MDLETQLPLPSECWDSECSTAPQSSLFCLSLSTRFVGLSQRICLLALQFEYFVGGKDGSGSQVLVIQHEASCTIAQTFRWLLTGCSFTQCMRASCTYVCLCENVCACMCMYVCYMHARVHARRPENLRDSGFACDCVGPRERARPSGLAVSSCTCRVILLNLFILSGELHNFRVHRSDSHLNYIRSTVYIFQP